MVKDPSLAGDPLELVEQVERLARGERVDVERVEPLAQRVDGLLGGLDRGGEQRQLAEARGEPAGLGAALLELVEHRPWRA